MERFGFFFKYALNHLKHGGQRVFIAILAIAFGVMSLITMISVSNAINKTIVTDARVQLGGDIRLTHPDRDFSLADFALLEALKANGEITAYSPVSQLNNLLLRTSTNGQANMVQTAIGIDPSSYPLAGELIVASPEGQSVQSLLQEQGATLITRDVAQQNGLAIGDTLIVAQHDGTRLNQPLHITGILSGTPTYFGQRIYYNLATAEALANQTEVFQYAVVSTNDIENAARQLTTGDWQIARLDQTEVIQDSVGDFLSLMLRGAGVLGLIVGGIGIANTMQVLLAQRKQEVGILKTLGCSQANMVFIFLLEVGLMGLLGGVLGAIAAIFTAQWVIQLFTNMGNMLIHWEFDLVLILGGILISLTSSILFALYAIVRSSNVRPTVIFRQDNQESSSKLQWLQALGFYALLSVPFAGITSLIMGSVIEGVGVLLVALGGLAVFTLLLGGLTWIILRVLPSFGNNMLRMARNNMRKRILSLMFAMIALFIGIFTIGFAIAIIQTGLEQFTVRQDISESHNLLIYTDMDTLPEVEAFLTGHNVEIMDSIYSVPVERAYLEGTASSDSALYVRDSAWDIRILDGPEFGTVTHGVYLSPYHTQADYIIETADGARHVLPVIGHYEMIEDNTFINSYYAPVISMATLESLDLSPQTVNLYAKTDADQQNTLAQQVGAQFPQAMTITRQMVGEQLNTTFMNVLLFALAMAGLSIIAGLMLVANVVSLAMIERRKEIGVMKAVGYTQRHILTLFGMEYMLIGLTASVIGVVAVQTVMFILAFSNGLAASYLTMNLLTGGLIIVVGVALTLIIALLSAWKPSGIRPLLILNEQAG